MVMRRGRNKYGLSSLIQMQLGEFIARMCSSSSSSTCTHAKQQANVVK